MIKIGVLGAGHLGKIHIRLLKEIADFQLMGFYDPDPEKADSVSNEFGIKAYSSISELIDDVDAVDIVTPTLNHYACAVQAIEKGKHFFVEKPLTNTVAEATELVKLVKESGLKAQVGHVERFNPAFIAAQQAAELKPMFIEAHRLSEFKPRGTDVSVILDLMIHDIDIVLSMVDADITFISASGVPVISDTVDIANARIEFANGCVANLTSSRVSMKIERKMRIFQKNAYITLDFNKKETVILNIRNLKDGEDTESFLVLDPGDGKPRKELTFVTPKMPEINAIKYELELFARSIIDDTKPAVDINDGFRSLKVAHQILEKIDSLLENAVI